MENFIKNNRKDFDLIDPSEGHFYSFEKKMKKIHKKSYTVIFMRYAALFIIIFLLTVFITFINSTKDQVNNLMISEINDIELYYKMQAIQCRNTIENAEIEDQIKNELYDELKNIDTDSNILIEEYKSSEPSDNAQQALIECYERKIRTISFVKEKINSINNQKTK